MPENPKSSLLGLRLFKWKSGVNTKSFKTWLSGTEDLGFANAINPAPGFLVWTQHCLLRPKQNVQWSSANISFCLLFSSISMCRLRIRQNLFDHGTMQSIVNYSPTTLTWFSDLSFYFPCFHYRGQVKRILDMINLNKGHHLPLLQNLLRLLFVLTCSDNSSSCGDLKLRKDFGIIEQLLQLASLLYIRSRGQERRAFYIWMGTCLLISFLTFNNLCIWILTAIHFPTKE